MPISLFLRLLPSIVKKKPIVPTYTAFGSRQAFERIPNRRSGFFSKTSLTLLLESLFESSCLGSEYKGKDEQSLTVVSFLFV